MTEEQITKLKEKMLEYIASLTDDELQAYVDEFNKKMENIEKQQIQSFDCSICAARDICVYATEVVPKTQKVYFCKDATERYLKMNNELNDNVSRDRH